MEIKEFDCETSGNRLDVYLTELLSDQSRTFLKKLIVEGHVLVNNKTEKSSYKVQYGDHLKVIIPPAENLNVIAEDIDIDILYEDLDIVVVNKARGMVVHPAAGNYTGTLVNAILGRCGESLSSIGGVIRPGIVHRIDKDTSGVLVIAKNNVSHEFLCERLKEHDIKRVYEGIVEGVIYEESGRVEAPIGRHITDRKKMAVNTRNGKHAITHFRVIERFNHHTHVEFRLETGRTHQIRVHMNFIGHPMVGDSVYGKKKQLFDICGQALHAKVLGFKHPTKGEYVEFAAKLPEDFESLLNTLRIG